MDLTVKTRKWPEHVPVPKLTDTDRLDALFSLFGGFYAFDAFFKIQEHFRDGRRGLDKFIAENSSLLGMKAP